MAAARSLGLHSPSGLSYLIAEGFLPAEPSESQYQWETYNDSHGLEEVLATDRCVVWSRSGIVKKTFSFDAENETVKQAVLTWFPADDTVENYQELGQTKKNEPVDSDSTKEGNVESRPPETTSSDGGDEALSRALVVFLHRHAHIFFLSGASHIVHLHFDVHQVFPAPRGLIIERKLTPDSDFVPATPVLPTAPPNSFFSPFVPTIGPSQPPSQNGVNTTGSSTLDFDLLRRNQSAAVDNLPRHFSLTSPLAEVGLIVHAPQGPHGSFLSQGRKQEDLTTLGNQEEVLYVSSSSELPKDATPDGSSLILVVTANKDRQIYSIWQALYADSKSATLLFKDRPPPCSGAKTRRRSSFVTQTGATTPALRAGEGFNESFTVKKRGKKLNTLNASQSTALSEAGEEDLIASQLGPEFDSRQTAKASRRVSSLLSRAELSTSQDRSAFQELATHASLRQSFGPGGRRGQSLGGAHGDRTSFGIGSQRRLRSSTPGQFSRLSLDDASESGTIMNFGLDDTMMIDDFDDFDDIFIKHAELDVFDFRLPFDGLRRELLFHRIAEIPMSESIPIRYSFGSVSNSNLLSSIRIFTIASQEMSSETGLGGRRHFLHIMNREAKEHIQFEFSIQNRRRPLPEPRSKSGSLATPLHFESIPVAIAKKTTRLKGQTDALKIEDDGVSRVLCLRNKGAETSVQLYAPWSPETVYTINLDRLRIFSPFDFSATPESSPRAVGKQRTLLDIKPLSQILHPGPQGTISLRDTDDKLHRLQIQLAPRNDFMSRTLKLLLFVLPAWTGEFFLSIWWSRYQSIQDNLQREWKAFAQSVFTIAVALDENGRRRSEVPSGALKGSPSRTRKSSLATTNAFAQMLETESIWDGPNALTTPGWSWVKQSTNTEEPNTVGSLITAARDFIRSKTGRDVVAPIRANQELIKLALSRLLVSMHLIREESKLNVNTGLTLQTGDMSIVIAQLARWMDWPNWDWQKGRYYSLECAEHSGFEDITVRGCRTLDHPLSSQDPPSFYAWLEQAVLPGLVSPFSSLDSILNIPTSPHLQHACEHHFPRITALSKYFSVLHAPALSSEKQVAAIFEAGIPSKMLDTLPDAIVAVVRHSMAQCQATPPTTWSANLLDLINREDLKLLSSKTQPQPRSPTLRIPHASRDTHAICQASETPSSPMGNMPEYTDRIWISRLVFVEDRRLVDAMHMIEPLRTATAVCPHDPSWSEAQILDAQKEVIQWVMVRTFALAPGYGMAHFNSRFPLLTEKYTIHGYSMLCKMQPMGNTVSADRSTLSEDKYGWSWFHAGVAAGLSISRHAQGIDTSWIIFNRPSELTNRHAGMLLALGLNGHLKNVARWLCFKYLTPKHTMTSIGLLLGLSASHMGSMDTLVTRLLSVHITRMLPPGAAELNLSPLTQTAGLMGMGLLYCGTQHRRMSEVMLSEIENVDHVDPAETPVNVRDESYRLAAGFALGYINLGRGNDSSGLKDMRIVERLLVVAVGPRPVDLVHILDQATAGATIAIALIFLKTGNRGVARRVDVPDTLPQFDYVRPDVLLLRTLAKHLILWDEIAAENKWIIKNLPMEYRSFYHMKNIQSLKSEHLPFYYIMAGLLWSIGLRYSGSGNKTVCQFLVLYLDRFIRVCKLPAHRYDAKLTRNTIRNCQDLIALACATVMAGTGNLDVMRRLRMLHGRTNADTPYGSHLAAHMAMGALFLGAGTVTFSTSNLAIASLICAFYPLFPMDVTDNKAHLQPFRHLWVLAAEARCVVIREVDTNRPIRVPLALKLIDGTTQSVTAPCLLPELSTIAQIESLGTEYWPMTLDFIKNPSHLQAFKTHQTVYVQRRPAGSANTNAFSATFTSINDAQTVTLVGARKFFRSIFQLPFLQSADSLNDVALVLPGDERSTVWRDGKGSVVDVRLMLAKAAEGGGDRDALWNLRVLFKWAEGMEQNGHPGTGWLGQEVVRDLKAMIEERGRVLRGRDIE